VRKAVLMAFEMVALMVNWSALRTADRWAEWKVDLSGLRWDARMAGYSAELTAAQTVYRSAEKKVLGMV
jgi:hypothetical protein